MTDIHKTEQQNVHFYTFDKNRQLVFPMNWLSASYNNKLKHKNNTYNNKHSDNRQILFSYL